MYISFTTSIAFSPTDAMPLTRRVKMVMLAESAISATTVLLVAARAVNILRSLATGGKASPRSEG